MVSSEVLIVTYLARKMKKITITQIKNEKLIEAAKLLPSHGNIKLSPGKLLYLDIDDRFIHDLHPLIDQQNVKKPDYFSMGIGAHISIIYPNEENQLSFIENQSFEFKIGHFFKARTYFSTYFVLTVFSPELIKIRYAHDLEKRLNLNGFIVPMHITIGKTENI